MDLVSADHVDVVLCSTFTRITNSWGDVHVVMSLAREHGIDIVTIGGSRYGRRRPR